MKPYKLRHKQTGLYYQPIKRKYGDGSNLSKLGKIYQTSSNALNGPGDTILIYISTKQYTQQKELFDSLGTNEFYGNYSFKCAKESFEIEYI